VKSCERCGDPISKDRFCKNCRKAVLAEMKNVGYLQESPSPSYAVDLANPYRPHVRRITSGEWDNAVRAIESYY